MADIAALDELEQAARRVELARTRVLNLRRAYGRRQAGAAELTHAEAQLSAALDALDQERANDHSP